MSQILDLKLDHIERDEEQPRKGFEDEPMKELKAAIKRWGQMQPIIVRKEGDKYILVDGERRWRALKDLATESPEQYGTIKAVLGTDDDANAAFRKARQLIVNVTAQDLTPSEKADTIATLQTSNADGNEHYGLTHGNLKLLKRLAGASDYVRAFGEPRTYSVPRKDGKGRAEKRECRPLSLTHLIELVALDNTLRAWDALQLRANKEHKCVASREVRRIAERAQKEDWSRVKLKAACDKVLAILDGEKRTRSTGATAIIKSVKAIEERLQKMLASDDADDAIDDLQAAIDALAKLVAQKKAGNATQQPAA
jgi:ParB-like chromosome segregation protein Spo0J